MLKTSTREEELLLCCAQAHLEGPTAERAHALLQKDVDWNRLVALAEQHFVVTRMYTHLNDMAFDRVPRIVSDEQLGLEKRKAHSGRNRGPARRYDHLNHNASLLDNTKRRYHLRARRWPNLNLETGRHLQERKTDV